MGTALAAVDNGQALMELFQTHDGLEWRSDDPTWATTANALAPFSDYRESDGNPVASMARKLGKATGGRVAIMVEPSRREFYGEK